MQGAERPNTTTSTVRELTWVRRTFEAGIDDARNVLERLEHLGIHLSQVTQELEDEGVQAFVKSYDNLLQTIRNVQQ